MVNSHASLSEKTQSVKLFIQTIRKYLYSYELFIWSKDYIHNQMRMPKITFQLIFPWYKLISYEYKLWGSECV